MQGGRTLAVHVVTLKFQPVIGIACPWRAMPRQQSSFPAIPSMDLTLILGPMKSGKSFDLISHFAPLQYTDISFGLFQSARNQRDATIFSRTGSSLAATKLASLAALLDQEYEIVGIDEVHMFAPGGSGNRWHADRPGRAGGCQRPGYGLPRQTHAHGPASAGTWPRRCSLSARRVRGMPPAERHAYPGVQRHRAAG